MLINEFSVGFGPAILKSEADNITYALRALPLGGYVSFPVAGLPEGDEESSYSQMVVDPDDPNLLENRPFMQQALVVCAGVIANLMLSWALLFTSSAVIGTQVQMEPPTVMRVLPKSPAASAGIVPGDRLVDINGKNLAGTFDEPLTRAIYSIRNSLDRGEPVRAVVLRAGERVSVTVPPTAGASTIGIEMAQDRSEFGGRVRLPPAQAATIAASDVYSACRAVLASLGPALGSVFGGSVAESGLSGPLGIAKTAGDIAQSRPELLLNFAAILSVNLAVFNSLPIPGLDGFQLLVLAIEALRGDRLPDRTKSIVNGVATVLLLYVASSTLVADVGRAAPLQTAAVSSVLPQLTLAVVVLLFLPTSFGGGDEDDTAAQLDQPKQPKKSPKPRGTTRSSDSRRKAKAASIEKDSGGSLSRRLARYWAQRSETS